MEYGDKITIAQLKAYNAQMGHYFFSRDTMRFFLSRVDTRVYTGADGWYFVTSEKFESYIGGEYVSKPRLYTVRVMRENGNIDEIGNFQEYDTLDKARRAAKQAAQDSCKQGADNGQQ